MIAIDFESVLVNRKGIPTEPAYCAWGDKPMKRSIDALWLFTKRDIKFYIHTARPDSDFPKIRKWLEKWGYSPDVMITREKQPDTTIYLDDRAFRFTSWKDFYKYIL